MEKRRASFAPDPVRPRMKLDETNSLLRLRRASLSHEHVSRAGRLSTPWSKNPSDAADDAAEARSMAVAAPRLTRMCEFEDALLEAEYKYEGRPPERSSQAARSSSAPTARFHYIYSRCMLPLPAPTHRRNEGRQELKSRTASIAAATGLIVFSAAVVSWAVGTDDSTFFWYRLVYASCWLAYAGYARGTASQHVPLGRVENLFTLLFVCSWTDIIFFGQKSRALGYTSVPMHQLFIASLAAAYAQLNVSHCAVIASAGTIITVRQPARRWPLSLPTIR
jgi:hypothetical protein